MVYMVRIGTFEETLLVLEEQLRRRVYLVLFKYLNPSMILLFRSSSLNHPVLLLSLGGSVENEFRKGWAFMVSEAWTELVHLQNPFYRNSEEKAKLLVQPLDKQGLDSLTLCDSKIKKVDVEACNQEYAMRRSDKAQLGRRVQPEWKAQLTNKQEKTQLHRTRNALAGPDERTHRMRLFGVNRGLHLHVLFRRLVPLPTRSKKERVALSRLTARNETFDVGLPQDDVLRPERFKEESPGFTVAFDPGRMQSFVGPSHLQDGGRLNGVGQGRDVYIVERTFPLTARAQKIAAGAFYDWDTMPRWVHALSLPLVLSPTIPQFALRLEGSSMEDEEMFVLTYTNPKIAAAGPSVIGSASRATLCFDCICPPPGWCPFTSLGQYNDFQSILKRN
ncbi:uncharacterized protein BDR25DRAFT_350706 [Lindgomyces ingoldianus]|uniref:Uncharacterized protein n=1 Tax=Lindgomyces ingoldianus TaxID=673940 RepID=A0ACB6R9W4_9PLEO|nr:uncharacterized protein BDR25DRAFT_350706 [Lindgomyces ingoldianus]KAF2475317.1 hypothetical protein BDR25DRAFT_350706 [Lindgomyces ingoldianus]